MKNLKEIISLPLDRKIIIRKNFLLNCIILTFLSALVAVGSSKFLFKYNLPVDNFVTLETSGTLEIICEDEFLDSGVLSHIECENEIYEIYTSRASAGALSRVGGVTYLLTADHFCDTDDMTRNIPPEMTDSISIKRKIYKDGNEYEFSILKQNPDTDLCLISSEDYIVDEKLKLAKSMPELGELTTTVSSPLGVSEDGVSLHFSGTFSGCNSTACFFTIPAISGSSGSLVLNYEKEVIGITQRSLVGFPEVTIGVGIYDITEFIREYEAESDIDITP